MVSRSFINFNLKINSIILDSFLQSEAETRHQFYKILSQPLQTACSISKKIGGEWLGARGTVLNMTLKVTSKFIIFSVKNLTLQTIPSMFSRFFLVRAWPFLLFSEMRKTAHKKFVKSLLESKSMHQN